MWLSKSKTLYLDFAKRYRQLLPKQGRPGDDRTRRLAGGPLLDMVNKVADAMGRELPDYPVETLAYQDEQKLIDEFLLGYYGAATPHLMNYLNIIQDSFAQTGKPLGIYQADHSHLTVDVVGAAWQELQDAQKTVASKPIVLKRVQRESLALDNVIIRRHNLLRIEASAKHKLAPFLPQDARAFIDNFVVHH